MPKTPVAEFRIDLLEILDQDGTVDPALEPDLPADRLLNMYRTMRLARRLDERAIALQRRGELGTYAPAIGQEAAQVGSAMALDATDWIVPAFREHPAALARGAPITNILLYAMGFEEGAAIASDQHITPPAIPVGSQALHGAGIGWAHAIREEPTVALTYFGDGATSTGDVYEALNFAGVYDAQTVFLCQNNQYAISTPRTSQSAAETLAQKAIGAGIHGLQIDGNDILAVYEATRVAVERARNGEPVLIEAVTYRRSMHTTSDDPRKYRTEEEEAQWEARDPLVRFETYLSERDILSPTLIEEFNAEIETEIQEGIEQAQRIAETHDPADMFTYAYETLPPSLTAQRDAFEGED